MAHRISNVLGHLQTGVPHMQANKTAFKKRPVKVCVTGACGNIAYSIIFQLGQGKMFGPDQPIELRLLDIPPMAEKIKGVIMEVNDCAFPLITSVVGTTDYKIAFEDVEVALLIGAKPRGKGMVRADLLKANAGIFKGQGKALNDYASYNVKIVVVGNPANTNALICMENAPRLPKTAFSALTKLDQNRASGMLASRTGMLNDEVKNVVIWGNHSATQYPDITHGRIGNKSIAEAVGDVKWLQGEFISKVQKRGKAIIQARGASSAASAANATVDHMRQWWCGTPEGEWTSMAVCSDGSYGIPKGLIFSFPVTCRNGEYSIVQNLPWSDFCREKIRLTTEELMNEKTTALAQ